MRQVLFPLVGMALLLSACSASYKTGQTPDDVYYSYGKAPVAEKQSRYTDDNAYQSYWDGDDSYLRMKVQNRNRWSQIDDLDYWYGYNNPRSLYNPSWSMYYGNSFNNPFFWNSWNMGFNSWTNPFCFTGYYNSWNNPYAWGRPIIVVNKFPSSVPAYRPGLNTGAYRNNSFDRGNSIFTKDGRSQNRSGGSDVFRSIFRTSGSSSGNSSSSSGWDRPARVFESSGSSSSGSSRSSGSGGSSSGSSGSSSSGSSRGGRGG